MFFMEPLKHIKYIKFEKVDRIEYKLCKGIKVSF